MIKSPHSIYFLPQTKRDMRNVKLERLTISHQNKNFIRGIESCLKGGNFTFSNSEGKSSSSSSKSKSVSYPSASIIVI